MIKHLNDKAVVFSITVRNLHNEALRLIGRELTDEEMYIAIEGVDAGLSFDIETVFKTAIEEAVNK